MGVPSLQRWHRKSVLVLTALIAVLAMHGLTSDHGMGMVGMRASAGSAMMASMPDGPDPYVAMSTIPAASADFQLSHDGGMCVGILGIALLLWLIARALRRNWHRVVPSDRLVSVRTIRARAGPLPPVLRPSLVTLGISRT